MPGRSAARGLLLVLAGLAAAPVALANGAFPDEFSVHFPVSAPHTILLGANFGLLVSTDDGAIWRYSCEPYVTTGSSAAISSYNVGFYQVTVDGAVLADSINLTRSADLGCTWSISGGSVAPPAVVSDIFADTSDATLALAVLSSTAGTSVVASHDGGKGFGPALYATSDLVTGVETAPSKAGVVYATVLAATGSGAHLLRSSDSGSTWASTAIPLSANAQPRIMAVDPANENIVYLRLIAFPNDSIVITADGGQSFQTALVAAGQLTSFLRASDGTLYAGTLDGHLYVRAPGAAGFATRTGPRLRCLGQRPGTTRIFACGDMFADGFSLGYSDDGAQTFQKMMSFKDLLGPLACPQVQTACAAHWARIQQVLGIAPADAGSGAPPSLPPKKSGCASAVPAAWGLLLLLFWRRKAKRAAFRK